MILVIYKVWTTVKWVIIMCDIWQTVSPFRPKPNLWMYSSLAEGDCLTAEMRLASKMQAHSKNLPSLLLMMFIKNRFRCLKIFGSSSSSSVGGSSFNNFLRLNGLRMAVPSCWSWYSTSLSSKRRVPRSGSRLSLAMVGMSLLIRKSANFKVKRGMLLVLRDPTTRGSTISSWKWGAKRWGVRADRSSHKMILSLIECMIN